LSGISPSRELSMRTSIEFWNAPASSAHWHQLGDPMRRVPAKRPLRPPWWSSGPPRAHTSWSGRP
jgi:hypothetical protein